MLRYFLAASTAAGLRAVPPLDVDVAGAAPKEDQQKLRIADLEGLAKKEEPLPVALRGVSARLGSTLEVPKKSVRPCRDLLVADYGPDFLVPGFFL